MDLTTIPAPSFTAVDGITQGSAAILYLIIGVAAWLRGPTDVRSRVFLAFSLANLLAFVLPVAGIVSLLRTHREIQDSSLTFLRKPLELILLSQIAGGTLAILFAPVLAVLAPNSATQSVLTVMIWALGLMTPIAYAI